MLELTTFPFVSDPNWCQCGSGSSFLPQCVSGSRKPNQYRSGSWLGFAVPKVGLWSEKYALCRLCHKTYLSWYKGHLEGWKSVFSQFPGFWIRIRNPNSGPDSGEPINADPCGSRSETQLFSRRFCLTFLLPPKSMSSEKFDIKHLSVKGDYRKKSTPLWKT
jgi:hypothetical protein